MTHAHTLDELERDVERARARLVGNIARLRDPRTISHARADLMAQANGYRERLVETVSGAANERTQGFMDVLRQRAQDNPAAVAAIAAGVLWRLWKRPPVATLLVGAGLASLLAGRGEEDSPPVEGLLGRVQEVNRATHALSGRAADLAERARTAATDLAEQARTMADQTAQTITHATERKGLPLVDRDGDGREGIRATPLAENPLAMSLAAMAVGAAFGLALRRGN